MSALSHAIAAERWDAAAYCLLVAALRRVEALPPETLSSLLALLSEDADAGPS